ncbi:hypothetical protein [Aliiroseovarius crassostreae]|uniref:hypothetical protein n=1 Tax=Aliiroseovarius crassostreae TaxID=154981 RepID=UPI002207FD96|nr:hypothetical protein [Aliiroseovarius crassostreae]UWP97870.1 hypothetical protein K3X53_10850 [Aliiroseovarius crassostreae]
MVIKLSKKKVAAYNKSQTPPETPDKAQPFIDRMTVGINFTPDAASEAIHSNIWSQLADTKTFPPAKTSGGYHKAWRVAVASAVKFKHHPFMQYRHASKCAARLSLSFSPHDLGEQGLDEMHIALKSMIDGGWEAFIDAGTVSMIEVSVDLPGIPMSGFHVLPQQTTTVKTWSNAGQLETVVFGKKKGNQTRIYDRAQKRMAKKQAWAKGKSTRVERVLRSQVLPVTSLPDLSNAFSHLALVDLPATPPPGEPKGKEYVWHLFCDAVHVRGLPVALKLLPEDSYRKRYRKWLAQHAKPWWQPEQIWQGWKPMIKKTRLTKKGWF